MAILLQIVFSFMVALIAVHLIGWVIRKVNAQLVNHPTAVRGVYATAAVCTFVLSFHEVNRIVPFQ